jgi:hypothetical protein
MGGGRCHAISDADGFSLKSADIGPDSPPGEKAAERQMSEAWGYRPIREESEAGLVGVNPHIGKDVPGFEAGACRSTWDVGS